MKTFKKIGSIFMVLMLTTSLMTPAFATVSNNSSTVSNQGSSKIDNVNNEQLLRTIFNGDSSGNINNIPEKNFDSSDIQIKYNYDIVFNKTENSYAAFLNMGILDNNNLYQTRLEGNLNTIEITPEITLLTGPLSGQIKINGHMHNITVGFNNICGSKEASMCVTLYDSTDMNKMISFRFGDNIITTTMIDELARNERRQKIREKTRSKAGSIISSAFTENYSGTSNFDFGSEIKGIGQKVTTAYRKASTTTPKNKFAVVVQSYTDKVVSQYVNAYYASVYEVEITLTKQDGKSNLLNFANLEHITNNMNSREFSDFCDTLSIALSEVAAMQGPTINGFITQVGSILMGDLSTYYYPYCNSSQGTFRTHFGVGPKNSKHLTFDDIPFIIQYNIYSPGVDTSNFKVKSALTYAVLTDGGFTYPTSTLLKSGITAFFVGSK